MIAFGIVYSGSSTVEVATASPSQSEIVLLKNGDYLDTTIIDVPVILSNISTFSITKTKTTRYKNKNGTISPLSKRPANSSVPPHPLVILLFVINNLSLFPQF